MQDVLVAVIPTVVAALLAAAGVWLRSRTRAHRWEETLKEVEARIRVIKSMLEEYRDDPVRGPQLKADLDAAYRQMDAVQEAAKQEKSGAGLGPLVRDLMFLDRVPTTVAGKVLQALYYLSLAWALLWLAAAVMFGLAGAFADSGESFGVRLGMSFAISVLALGIGLAPGLVLYPLVRAWGGFSRS